MKNNREQLFHAFENLRGDTLNEAVTAMETPSVRRTAHTRRWMTATAACLSALLLLGAAMALPMLGADGTITPAGTNEMSGDRAPFYYDVPLVKLGSMTAGNEEDGEGQDIVMDMWDYDRVAHEFYFLFDALEEGETLTLTSRNALIAQAEMYQTPGHHVTLPGDRRTTPTVEGGEMRLREVSEYAQTVTYDPSLSEGDRPVFLWSYRALTEEACIGGRIYEDYVDFVIRDAEGNVTGAGSLYLADKKMMTMQENNRYYPMLSVSRGEVLGAVRFHDPAAINEEQVGTLLGEMHGKADGLSAKLFEESTYTPAEAYIRNWAYVMETNYAEYLGAEHTELVLRGATVAEGVRHLMISTIYEPESIRHFFFFEDGTFAEAADIKCVCPDCGEVEIVEHPFHDSKHPVDGFAQQYYHGLKSVWVCYFTDGRVMEVSLNSEGVRVYTFVSSEESAA